MTCSLGEIGGLLFLGLLTVTVLIAAAALVIGWIAGIALDDVNRLEASQYQHLDKDK